MEHISVKRIPEKRHTLPTFNLTEELDENISVHRDTITNRDAIIQRDAITKRTTVFNSQRASTKNLDTENQPAPIISRDEY